MLVLAATASAASAAEETAIGSAAIVGADTEVSHAAGAFGPLKAGAPVHQGDRVRSKGASVKIVFLDQSSVSLAPRSELELNEFVYKPQASRRSMFKLWGGKLKASISKFLSGDNDVRIATPTAVAGVRGTEFLVGVTQKEGSDKPEDTTTDVVVFDGKVNVKSALEKVAGDINLTAGQSTLVAFAKAPGAAITLSPEALRGLQRSASAKNKGSVRASVSEGQLSSATSGVGVRRSSFGGASLGPPPIQQQPTDAKQGSTLTIRVHVPDQQ
jgi:hypothetical protein